MDDEAMGTALEVFSQSFRSSSKGLPVYFGNLTFMQAEDRSAFLPSAHEEGMAAWREACIGDVDVRVVPGNHFSMIAHRMWNRLCMRSTWWWTRMFSDSSVGFEQLSKPANPALKVLCFPHAEGARIGFDAGKIRPKLNP